MGKQHNRRQRKKLRIGEFRELGFSARARFVANSTPTQREETLDAFVAFIEANGMLAAASTSDNFAAFLVSTAPRGSTTESQRAATEAWMTSRDEMSDIAIGELTDAWHPVDN